MIWNGQFKITAETRRRRKDTTCQRNSYSAKKGDKGSRSSRYLCLKPRRPSVLLETLCVSAVNSSVASVVPVVVQNTILSFLASIFSASTPGTFLRSSIDLNLPFLVR